MPEKKEVQVGRDSKSTQKANLILVGVVLSIPDCHARERSSISLWEAKRQINSKYWLNSGYVCIGNTLTKV